MTAKCHCPKDLDQLYLIEYPGLVKNIDKALDTMGGMTSIEQAFESQSKRLELKFRKADPLAHAAYGDRCPKKCLMLRITKKKVNDDEGVSKGFSLEVVGRIQTAFRFDTLAEFQWLPMQRTNLTERFKSEDVVTGVKITRSAESLNATYESILDEIVPTRNVFDNKLKNFNSEAPLVVLPALFSRFDTPREIHQPHPKFRSKEMRAEFEKQQQMSIIGRTRKKRCTMSYLLNFNDEVPNSPPEKLVKDRQTLSQQEREMIPTLGRCFEKQKVWSKAALCLELNCNSIDIKYILPLVGFHYQTGPFRTMWVKYGYNPHKDVSSKSLQTLDFRVKYPLDQHEYSKRSTNQYQIPLRKNAEKTRTNQQVDLKLVMQNNAFHSHRGFDDLDGIKNMSHIESMVKFRKDTIPSTRQLSYQLKDIELDEVQSILHSNDGKEPVVCSEKDGWLVEGSLDKIRKIMTKTLARTMDTATNQIEINPPPQAGTSASETMPMDADNMDPVVSDLYETTS